MSGETISKTGFKIVVRYCYSPIESVEIFPTKEAAREELKRWKKTAAEQGQHMIGRIVAAGATSPGTRSVEP